MNTFYAIIQKHCKSTCIFFPNCNPLPNQKEPNQKELNQDLYNFWENIYKYELGLGQGPSQSQSQSQSHNSFIKFAFYHYVISSMHLKLKTPYYANRYPKVKMIVLNDILNNSFINDEQKEEILNIFTRCQRTYNAFSRLAFIYRVRKAQTRITTDLCLNPIDTSKNNVIQIYQNKSKYLFIIQDLINIIETSLANSTDFFVDPLPIKNPYNNVHFSIAILYNIYYFIKSKNYIIPKLFHLYFLENFNLKKFAINNEGVIREISIKNYIFNTPHAFLFNNILRMLNSNYFTRKLNISPEFPKEELVNILRPYLYLEHISRLSLNIDKRHEAQILLKERLEDFYSYNPQFGRKHINPIKNLLNANVNANIHANVNTTNIISFNNIHKTLNLNTLKKKWGPDDYADERIESEWTLMRYINEEDDNNYINVINYDQPFVNRVRGRSRSREIRRGIRRRAVALEQSPLSRQQRQRLMEQRGQREMRQTITDNMQNERADDEFFFALPTPVNLLDYI